MTYDERIIDAYHFALEATLDQAKTVSNENNGLSLYDANYYEGMIDGIARMLLHYNGTHYLTKEKKYSDHAKEDEIIGLIRKLIMPKDVIDEKTNILLHEIDHKINTIINSLAINNQIITRLKSYNKCDVSSKVEERKEYMEKVKCNSFAGKATIKTLYGIRRIIVDLWGIEE